MAREGESLLAQRARERAEKKNEMQTARKSNLQQYVQILSANAAPKTMGASNRALPPQREQKESSSKLVQEIARMSSKVNGGQEEKRKEKEKQARDDARSERENDARKKREDKQQEESNRNFDTLGNVFKSEGGKIVDAVEELTKQLKRQQQQHSSGGSGDGPSLFEQLQEFQKNRKKKGGGRGVPGVDNDSDLDIDGFDDPHTSAEDRKKAKRARRIERLRRQRSSGRGLRGALNRARGFGSRAVDAGEGLLERGEGLLERGKGLASKLGESRALKLGGKVLGHVGAVASAADAVYNAAPLIGDVFDSSKDTTDRVKAGAHLAVQGAGAGIGGILGGAQGAAYGAEIGDKVADAAEWLGEKFAENVDVYDLVNDPKGPLQTALGSVRTGYDAIVSSDFGKALGMTAAVAMSPFSEDARQALKQDWNNDILPKFESKFDVLTNALGNYGSALAKAGGDIIDGLKKGGGNIVDGFKDAGSQIADGWKKNGLVGALQSVRGTAGLIGAGFGRAAGSAADGVANAGSSLKYGLQKGTTSNLDLALGFSAKTGFKGMNDSESKAYAANVMRTESGGALGITNQYGFAGQYQFGADALADNGLIDKDKLMAAKKAAGGDWYKGGLHKKFMEDSSNWTNKGGRDAFLNDKQLQDDTFVKYTNKNIDAGYRSGALTANSSAADIAAYAKASHLKGSGGANDYFLRGIDSADANGMRVSTYANDAKSKLLDLTAKVDDAKKNGYTPEKSDASRVTTNSITAANTGAKVAAKANAPTAKVAGQVNTSAKTEAQPAATDDSLASQLGSAESPWRTATRNFLDSEKKREAEATRTATASASPIPMVDKSTPAEMQRVLVANPTPPSDSGKTAIVQAGGGGGTSLPTLDEIPMIINDMGLVLLNTGHV